MQRFAHRIILRHRCDGGTMDSWHDEVFFGIHYDLHAKAEDTELGANLTHEHLRERFRETRPDWVQCDCKGHPGWTSWPTTVGSTSPGVVRDAVRIHRDVTNELGIRLGMHYSGVIDKWATELHPEWLITNADGSRDDSGRTCPHSKYADELMIPQMLELVDKYDVDGFWVDGDNWGTRPCWCESCKAGFIDRTGLREVPVKQDEENWAEWIAYHRELFVEYVTKYADAVHATKPSCAVCSNWMYTARQPDPISAPVNYLSGDYTFDWGAYRAAIEGRMLDNRNFSWDLMVWGFSKTIINGVQTKLWQFKTPVHLKQEVSEVIALGGAIMVYAKSERDGHITNWQNRTVAEVGDFCRERKALCFRTQSASEAAILHPAESFYEVSDPLFLFGSAIEPVEGALHGLLENHISTDIITLDRASTDLADYRLLIVPERQGLSAETVDTIRKYAVAGGNVIISGEFLSREHPDLCGCRYVSTSDPVEGVGFLPVAVGDRAVCFMGKWATVATEEGTETVEYFLKIQESGEVDTNRPFITRITMGEGSITAIHGPFFKNYFTRHYPYQRELIGTIIDGLNIDWKVSIDASRRVELIQRKRNGNLYLNLLNRGANEYLGPNRVMIDELSPTSAVKVRVVSDGAPKAVELHPGGTSLDWSYLDGAISFVVPEVAIHDIVEIDFHG